MEKNLPDNVKDTEDMGLIPGLGRSRGVGKGYPLQYSCLGNPMEEEPGGLQSMRLQRVGYDWVTNIHTHIHTMKYYLALKRKKVLGLS